MPQTVTFKITPEFKDGGPKMTFAIARDSKVASSLSVLEDVPNDRNWTEYELLGGDRSQIEYLMLAAERYKDEHCPREDEPGLLFKFEDQDGFALHLDGPLLYSGHTASCLPPRVDKIFVQNRMAERVKLLVVLGRKPKKNPKNGKPAVADAGAMAPAAGQPAATPAPSMP